jgi:tetratricopeptide (TPR) repeat protein
MALSIALSLTDDSNAQLTRANSIYVKYFTANGKDLPFDKYSITAHKVIGTLFSRQGKYKESIAHFEYISEKLKDSNEKSKIHSSIGNDYEALGDMDKALAEYKLALEQ